MVEESNNSGWGGPKRGYEVSGAVQLGRMMLSLCNRGTGSVRRRFRVSGLAIESHGQLQAKKSSGELARLRS
jgi:hypothetical protein